MPIISIIIPAYNAAPTINETIQSVLSQTFIDYECIIINDGSTDETLAILSRITDPRFKIISQQNYGLSYSRNYGIDSSVGDYIAFLDADDIWGPDKLECQLKAFDGNPKIGLVYSWTDFINADGDFMHKGGYSRASGNVYKYVLLNNMIESGSNPLIRKEVFELVGKFDISLIRAEDRDMWIRIAAKYEFAVIEKVQIFYRQSKQSLSASLVEQSHSCISVLAKAFDGSDSEVKKIKNLSYSNVYVYTAFRALTLESRKFSNFMFACRCLIIAFLYRPQLYFAIYLFIYKIIIKVIVKTNFRRKNEYLDDNWEFLLKEIITFDSINRFPNLDL